MDLKEQLLHTLRNELNIETVSILEQNIKKRSAIQEYKDTSRPKTDIGLGPILGNYNDVWAGGYAGCGSGSIILILSLIIIVAIGTIFYFGGKFVSNTFELNLFISILIEFGVLIVITLFIYLIYKFIKHIYSVFKTKINSVKPKNIEVKDDLGDDVYFIISSTYETLCTLNEERGRQAKNSFNVALGFIIVGVFIVFGGVFLLFKKSIVEGVLSSVVGSISNIIGGTIIKLHKDTNDRMDKTNADLFTLNTAKVQYALILKINNEKKRDIELSKLIQSIGKIAM